MRYSWEDEFGIRKLELKARAHKRTSIATASPETLAKKRRGTREGESTAMSVQQSWFSHSHTPNSVRL